MKKYLLKTYFLRLSILFLAQFSFGQLNITSANAPNIFVSSQLKTTVG